MEVTGILTAAPKSNLYSVCLIAMAVLLNQSTVISDMNITLADIFCGILLLYFVLNLRMKLPAEYFIFFFILSFSVLFTTAFLDEQMFHYTPDANQVMKDYSKLLVVFVYFLLGYNVARLSGMGQVVKWYSVSALLVGIFGLMVMALHISFFSDFILFGGVRLKGFMNDPNFFSVLEVTALPYFLHEKKGRIPIKIAASVVVVLAVLASGSKTGLLVLLGYLAFKIMESLLTSWKKADRAVFLLLIIVLAGLAAFLSVNALTDAVQRISDSIPSFARLSDVFGNFGSALTEGGSGRDTAWLMALNLIKISPITGIGIGVYTNITFELFGNTTLAHNTYLQAAAEWGVILAGVLFAYILFAIGKVSQNKHGGSTPIIARDILIIILLGSFGVSLNNARMLWLFLGAIAWFMRNDIPEIKRIE